MNLFVPLLFNTLQEFELLSSTLSCLLLIWPANNTLLGKGEGGEGADFYGGPEGSNTNKKENANKKGNKQRPGS